VKVPKEIVKIDNKKLNIKINVDLCDDIINKEKESILHFNESEIIPSNRRDGNSLEKLKKNL
jgi:hypothetical protein